MNRLTFLFWDRLPLIARLSLIVVVSILCVALGTAYQTTRHIVHKTQADLTAEYNQQMDVLESVVLAAAFTNGNSRHTLDGERLAGVIATFKHGADISRVSFRDSSETATFSKDITAALEAPLFFSRWCGLETINFNRPIIVEGTYFGLLSLSMSPNRIINEAWTNYRYLLQVIIFSLTLVLSSIWLILRRALHPLRTLAEATQTFAQGDLSVRVSVAGSPELRTVLLAFNQMSARFQATLAELRASEARFQQMVNSIEDVLYSVDGHSGEFQYRSPAFERMLGYTQADITAGGGREKLLAQVIQQDQFAWQQKLFQQLQAGQTRIRSERWESWWRCKDGSLKCIEDHWFPVQDATGLSCTNGVLRDVTERKRAEAALRASEEHNRTILHAAMDGIWRVDLQGRLLEVNKAYCRMSGYSEQELLSMSIPDLESAETAAATAAHIQKIREHGEDRFESRHRRKDGIVIDVEVAVQFRDADEGSMVAFLHDITNRKQAEEALRASRNLLEGIINAIPVSVFWKDRNLVYLGCNAAFARDAGFTDPNDIVGKDDYQMGWCEQADRYRGDDRVVIESGSPKLLVEEPLTAPEGKTLTILTSKMPLRNSQGEISGILGVYQDITRHKRDEAELQKMENLQSVGVLAGGIAHDFNNILLGLFGNISIAMDELSKEHPSYAPLEEAEKSMSRAVRLTKQLLTFAKGGDPVKEHVSLADMVEEVARFDLTGSSVNLVYHPAENLWSVEADRGQLQQVISNLAINARQAMPKGGRLIVSLENADFSEASISTLSRGRYVKVIVQDEGVGINPKVIDHIFDPYFTTKPTGSGLGLATVWSIINKHGGHIGVVSELGKGTVFTFYLPAAASLQSAEAKPQAAEGLPPASPAKILMMDDEEAISRLAVRMLKPCGYTVTTAPNAQETIELYKQALETGAPFELIIMDLTIPGGRGGKDVIKDLLALDPHVRAIVSSGYAGDPVMANPAAYGFKGTVAKPYTARTLREAVSRALA